MAHRILTRNESDRIRSLRNELDRAAAIIGCNDARQYFPDAVDMLENMLTSGMSDGVPSVAAEPPVDDTPEVVIDDKWAAVWPRRWVMVGDRKHAPWCGPYRLGCVSEDGQEFVMTSGECWGYCRPATVEEIATVEAAVSPLAEESAVEKALATLRAAMSANSDYAWTWHCNLTMMAVDAGAPHDAADDHAATFMRNAFDVDVKKCPQWAQISASTPEIPAGYRPATAEDKECREDLKLWNGTRWVSCSVPAKGEAIYSVPVDRIPTDEDARQNPRPTVLVRDHVSEEPVIGDLYGVKPRGENAFLVLRNGVWGAYRMARFPYPGEPEAGSATKAWR
jgi:hypothetical protein